MSWKRTAFWLASLVLVGGLWSQAEGQTTKRGSIETLVQQLERGDYDRLDELLQREGEALPVLLERAGHRSAEVRVRALDLLARIDLKDDGLLNREGVIRALVEAIDGSEKNPDVVNEALSSLEKIDPRKATPALTGALLTQLKNGSARAALILGRLEDPALIPLLEPYLASRSKAVAGSTKLAMAKLGDRRYFLEVLSELNVEGPKRSEAMRKLVYIGNKAAVREIARFLYDPGVPPSQVGPRDRVVHLPYRYMAAWALGQLVDNPPMKKDVGLLSEKDIEIWKTWWDAHRHENP